MKKIITISGFLCSGKTTYIKENYSDYYHLSTSSIVKKITGGKTRGDLTKKIIDESEIIIDLKEELVKHDKIVVDGIRQEKILRFIHTNYEDVEMIWLQPAHISDLKKRYEKQNDGTKVNDQNFEDAFWRDFEIGICFVYYYTIMNGGKIITN